ncbi:unnamed protein product [Arabidopsis thaliana]|jgi:hypothetical protein|uniref:Rho termination factor n=4 Tax=Arabidopsis TaxID=3701 RepID=Q8GWL7_ARATH|nr:Rho termination factor [Arabidopsis thaliana]KAG7639342.1 Rho termination factor N-terminal [Arabidopsis thaliana x Arabidopsis arenosa]KAG7643929.1 Rho termination factor N-terminal [Arabidopsis suecica]AAO63917.1 unknown protein [Arabidopsis thaliana]AEC09999.1 Rho termination factor [Arabidopsis thaliana]OAP10802.1 hypothetical protein AXX17_AT2G38820 [Arabidopsis thaliana]|eukprot:NP_181686.2 Rho termination factor [Arabidopsis thaliana]
MDDDDDLWGPPRVFVVVQDDTFRKQTVRRCEFWFDFRTDVLEENFQNEKYCELVWRILTEKKRQVTEIAELERVSVSVSAQNDTASSGSGGDLHEIDSSDSDKTLSTTLPDSDTSSAKLALDDDENTSSISDAQTAQTVQIRDSSNDDTEDIEPETRLMPHETAANDPLTVEVAEDADTSSSPVLESKIDEAEEHSCSSLVTDQVFDPIKQALENKSSSAISRESIGGSTLRPLHLETREKANTTDEDGDILKDHQQNDSLQDIVTVSEPFTTESLLEMCDEPDKGRDIPCGERSKKSHPEAVVKTVVKDELIISLLTEARKKAESKNPGSVLIKKRQRQSNSSDNKGANTSFIRNIKQKVQGGAGEINIDPVKNSTQSTPKIIRGSSVPTQHADSLLDSSMDGKIQRGGKNVSGSLISLSISELKKKTGKELRSIAKDLKVQHYYKLKKEDLLQRITNQLNPQLADCTKQRMES